jgi:hypothetical protein
MTDTTRRTLVATLAIFAASTSASAYAQAGVTPTEARQIAKDAYIYGFPLVDNYRIQYAYAIDKSNPEYKAPYNQLSNIPRVYTPADTAVQTPNSDTPYSMVGLNLRTEPIVLTVPPIEKSRYFSIQLIDAYTFNFDYIGSRTTGNGGGNFMVAGPGWKGETPKGISKVIASETDFASAIYRTQLFNPADLDNVKKVQAGYKVQPLSTFMGTQAPTPAPTIAFPKPLTPDEQKTSPEFFSILDFTLQRAPVHPSERDLRARFARLNIGGTKRFDVNALTPEVRAAMSQGMADAWTEFAGLKARLDAGKVTSGDAFGTRDYLKNNYLYRMGGAVVGIYGNSKQEAMYPIYTVDSTGQKLNGANRYTLRLAPGQLPPVNAFWSLTMYKLPESLLVANPIDRYLINSPMLPHLVKDADGGITLYVQKDTPGKDKEANWLPAPDGPFTTVMRLYWPKEEALNGKWKAPALQRQ